MSDEPRGSQPGMAGGGDVLGTTLHDAEEEATPQPPEEEAPPDKRPPARAYGYFGAGLISGDVSMDGGPDEDTGTGAHLLLGIKRGHFSLEFNAGTPPDNGFLGVGMKLDILPFDRFRFSPWVGVDLYAMEFFSHEDRGCISPAAGLDVMLTSKLVLRAGVGKCSYTEGRGWPLAGYSVEKDITFYMIDLIFRATAR